MIQLIQSVPFLFAGLFSVNVIDVIGALASKRFHFNYDLLALAFFLSMALSTISNEFNLNIAFLISLVIAYYDATIRWGMSKIIKPFTKLSEEQLKK